MKQKYHYWNEKNGMVSVPQQKGLPMEEEE